MQRTGQVATQADGFPIVFVAKSRPRLLLGARSASTPTTSSASMFIAPKSLTNTATRRPWSPFRIRLSSVVFPEPRNPV
jgi:hypothetical protein